MGKFRVVSFVEYLTDGSAWQSVQHQNTFHAKKFVTAIKGGKVNGWAEIPLPSGVRRLEEQNKSEVFGWFGDMVAAATGPKTPARLVPFPSSGATSAADVRKGPTFKLAEAIAAHFPKTLTVSPILYWKKPIASARKGGPRDASILFPLLALAPRSSIEPRCIVVDDVKTSGGHLRAAEAVLRAGGIKVSVAICAARTVHVEGTNAFEYLSETYERYEPEEDD